MKTLISKFNQKQELFYRIAGTIFILAWLSITTFFALTTRPGIPPDERYHLDLANFYKPPTTFFLGDTTSSYHLGVVSRTPAIYLLFMGKLLNLSFNAPDYLFARFVSISLSVVFLYFAYKTVRLLTKSRFIISLTFILLLYTSMLTAIFSSVSYDVFTNLFATILIYSFIRVVKLGSEDSLIPFLLVGLLGSLTKLAFIPLFAILSVLIIFIMGKELIKKIKSLLQKRRIWMSIIVTLVAFNSFYYIVNLIRFSSLTPACEKVLTYEQCMQNPIFARGESFKGVKKPVNQIQTAHSYYQSWNYTMVERSFGLFNHSSIYLNNNFTTFMQLFITFGLTIYIFSVKKKKHENLLLIAVLSYLGILLFKLYGGFLSSGIRTIAVQGRYTFPIIVPLYFFIAKGYKKLLDNHKIIQLTILIGLILLLNQYTYQDIIHKMAFHGDDYRQAPKVYEFIREASYHIPKIHLFKE